MSEREKERERAAFNASSTDKTNDNETYLVSQLNENEKKREKNGPREETMATTEQQ